MRSYLFTSLFLLIGISLSAQTIDQARLEALTEKQWQSGLRLLNELVAMPKRQAVHAQPAHVCAEGGNSVR
jgi:hypothetical protein